MPRLRTPGPHETRSHPNRASREAHAHERSPQGLANAAPGAGRVLGGRPHGGGDRPHDPRGADRQEQGRSRVLKYILDTDTCVFYLKGRPDVVDRFTAAAPGQLATSEVTTSELYFGAYNSARPEANLKRLEEFLSLLDVAVLNRAAARRFGELKARLRKEGRVLDDFDLLIAAIAESHGLTLVTNNVSDFGRISTLRIENWVR